MDKYTVTLQSFIKYIHHVLYRLLLQIDRTEDRTHINNTRLLPLIVNYANWFVLLLEKGTL